MLIFRKMQESDIPLIRRYMDGTGIRSCDFTVCGIYLWGRYYRYEIAEYEDTLFIKGLDEAGDPAFALPVGKLKIGDAVAIVREYCADNSLLPRFSFVPADAVGDFSGALVKKLDGWSDYIYEAEALATLAGKKLHKKRNRVNKFKSENPDWRFELLNKDNIAVAKAFFERYSEKYGLDDARLRAEFVIIELMLDEFFELGLMGGLLFSGEKCVAFTAGEIVGDTLYVHFEKADRDFDGSYETINCLFAANCSFDAKYIDREEDMGDEGLRLAKMSYYPAMFTDKYEVYYDR